MHPAFSVIVFTTLSGAGYGLLAWSAFAALSGAASARSLLVAIALGGVLAAIGLLASFWHLGKPLRAWRAFSQWRSSWLSREGVSAVATFVPALALAASLLPARADARGAAVATLGPAGQVAAVALAVLALATVACTAMIYVSLKPIPAWRHRLVLPGYLAFALLGGGLLLLALAAGIDARLPSPAAAKGGIVLAALLGALKLHYWRGIDAAARPVARGDAIGLPGRAAAVVERPHTEANYITREMVFRVARAHAGRLRALALLLFALAPIACLLLLGRTPVAATTWLWIAAAAALAGSLVERWLFFAQARHLVSLYY